MRKAIIVGAFALMALAPSSARADWLFTPFVGPDFGGDTTDQKLNYGASLGFMGAGIFGFEVDFGYSPDFFDTDNQIQLIDTSNVTTLMANAIIGAPIGGQHGTGVRPYASGGIGLLRTHVTSAGNLFQDINNNDFGVNVGAGLMGFFSDNVGLRGDLRYFRTLTDPERDNEFDIALGRFNYWRGTVGVVFRFGQ